MADQVNVRDLAAMVKAKRGKRGLRATAQEIGQVSASTLSRIEQGKVPDLDTFARICQWLGVPPERFMARTERGEGLAQPGGTSSASLEESTPQKITAYLRADRTLDPATAEALVRMIELAYAAANRGELAPEQRG